MVTGAAFFTVFTERRWTMGQRDDGTWGAVADEARDAVARASTRGSDGSCAGAGSTDAKPSAMAAPTAGSARNVAGAMPNLTLLGLPALQRIHRSLLLCASRG